MINYQSKLYGVTTEDCKLPLHAGRGYPAHDVPQLYWPDGGVCWLVNIYLLNGYRRGLSRENKGELF